ncbi:hypothetical protein BDV26DRAFT_298001 [Aspergillus bertholletiae]|uniref:Uncharacterized protein n=1 Tax=Aspergillus bertholletiae TaxID=1226010 RepID=A0A5N7AQZ9_9EURO|nr:hypothetical protein BDV26DRAFT_298001 [Aspergillus bertholletiae]
MCWPIASIATPRPSEAHIPGFNVGAEGSISSSIVAQLDDTQNEVQENLSTTEPDHMQNSGVLQYPTLPQAHSTPSTDDIVRRVDTDDSHRPMIYPHECTMETYEKLSCVLFTLHSKKVFLGEPTASLHTIDDFFQCVFTMCDLLETTVPAANVLINRAGYVTNNGIFKVGLMGISIVLEIYAKVLHNDKAIDCLEDFHRGKTPADVFRFDLLSDSADTMLRYTAMGIHLRRLQLILEAAGLGLKLDLSLSAQIDETRRVLDVSLRSLQTHGILL